MATALARRRRQLDGGCRSAGTGLQSEGLPQTPNQFEGRVLDDDAIPAAAITETKAAPRAPARSNQQPETKPAETKPAETGPIIDGEVLPPDDGDDFPGDRPDFLTRLETALNACSNLEALAEVWERFDAMAVLDGDDASQKRALEISRRAHARFKSEGK